MKKQFSRTTMTAAARGGGGGGGVPTTASAAADIDQHLPCIQRGSLEYLVQRHMIDGCPITLADLEAAPKMPSDDESSAMESDDDTYDS
mmetsp:Transcript_31538/g.92484  ORF Transcript_31538/g.92484 Transcript_31538/m.92484 type:complete len:89 (-) Transcript_31538:2180-2446(-)